MSSPGKGRGKENSARARNVARKANKTTLAKVTMSNFFENPSHFEGECRNCGKCGHKAADCWHKQPKPQGKGEAISKVSEVSESENSKHVEDTWTPCIFSSAIEFFPCKHDQNS